MLSGSGHAVLAESFEVATLFGDLATAPALVLAVSGGPDSTALLYLVARWRGSIADGPAIHVATVDHGLRVEAAAEAATVAAAAAALGLPHVTLAWSGTKPAAALQQKAREARYHLLSDHARSCGASYILTAHHADDQAETVLMRLGRGSGVSGLAAMRRMTPLSHDLMLVRPLLDLTKRDLLALCAAEKLTFALDPSNEDLAFHRVRLRRQAHAAALLGLDRTALLRLARRMSKADEAIEAEVSHRLAELQPVAETGLWRADLTPLQSAALEIIQRLLGRAILHAGEAKLLSLERMETLADALRVALVSRRSFRGTLGGTLLWLDEAGVLTVLPEPPRRRGRRPRLRPN